MCECKDCTACQKPTPSKPPAAIRVLYTIVSGFLFSHFVLLKVLGAYQMRKLLVAKQTAMAEFITELRRASEAQ